MGVQLIRPPFFEPHRADNRHGVRLHFQWDRRSTESSLRFIISMSGMVFDLHSAGLKQASSDQGPYIPDTKLKISQFLSPKGMPGVSQGCQ